MSESIRCFIAVKIPPLDALRPVLKELAAMGRAVKTVEPENLHVTLKFLGETDRNAVPEIGSVLKAAAGVYQRCVLNLSGLGVFPHERRPNVVWAGLEGSQTLAGLAVDLEPELEPLGFFPEERPFVPHLTLARIKARPPESLFDLLARHARTAFGTATIDHVELIRSELGLDGAKYTVLETARLGAS
jgi:RNA 2',3'-cyclic 3'-phosphodiesterase